MFALSTLLISYDTIFVLKHFIVMQRCQIKYHFSAFKVPLLLTTVHVDLLQIQIWLDFRQLGGLLNPSGLRSDGAHGCDTR
jgi:hypothetical protein